jgi:hypothetical protein
MNARLRTNPPTFYKLLSFSLSLTLLSCAGAGGTVSITAYGEEFIEAGIPASDVDDGWNIEFSRFEVTVSEVAVGGSTLEDAITVDLSDVSDGEGQELGTLEVPAGDHEESSFIIERVEVDGSASLDDEEKSFSWVFDGAVSYHECETTTSVVGGEVAKFQVTVHADHLFYDSLVAEDPQLLFQPLADADADADGEITQDELEDTDIGAYDPGSAGDVDDLWTFLNAQVATLGHVDGEGHCHATPLD